MADLGTLARAGHLFVRRPNWPEGTHMEITLSDDHEVTQDATMHEPGQPPRHITLVTFLHTDWEPHMPDQPKRIEDVCNIPLGTVFTHATRHTRYVYIGRTLSPNGFLYHFQPEVETGRQHTPATYAFYATALRHFPDLKRYCKVT